MTDEQFFQIFPDRNYHIRKPEKEDVVVTKGLLRFHALEDECDKEFRTLGPHDKNRRRIILYRLPTDNPHFDPHKPPILKVPFLAFADETIEDNDATLAPILHGIMEDARARYAKMQ